MTQPVDPSTRGFEVVDRRLHADADAAASAHTLPQDPTTAHPQLHAGAPGIRRHSENSPSHSHPIPILACTFVRLPMYSCTGRRRPVMTMPQTGGNHLNTMAPSLPFGPPRCHISSSLSIINPLPPHGSCFFVFPIPVPVEIESSHRILHPRPRAHPSSPLRRNPVEFTADIHHICPPQADSSPTREPIPIHHTPFTSS